ncbi:M61 family peptidase, partial [Xanthomonas perforans]
WALVYTDTPTAALRASEAETGVADLTYSIGLTVRADGMVRTVAWNGPAFAAGLRPGTRVLTVNGSPFEQDALRDAVRDCIRRPIVLGIAQDEQRADVQIQYTGPLRYPRLERLAGRPDTLAKLLAPR